MFTGESDQDDVSGGQYSGENSSSGEKPSGTTAEPRACHEGPEGNKL